MTNTGKIEVMKLFIARHKKDDPENWGIFCPKQYVDMYDLLFDGDIQGVHYFDSNDDERCHPENSVRATIEISQHESKTGCAETFEWELNQ